MRYSIVVCLAFAASVAASAPISFQPLPPPAFADTEVAEDISLDGWGGRGRDYTIQVSFKATPTNNVELLFATGCGIACGGTDFQIGYDCGKWFVAEPARGFREEATADGVATDTNRVLMLTTHLNSDGTFRDFRIADGETTLFTNILARLPALPAMGEWTGARLVARGVRQTGGERASIKAARSSIILIL